MSNSLEEIIARTERLGVIGSPSSTSTITMDIMGSAAARKLVGELAMFQFTQDSDPHYALGQITEVQLRNVWHEDSTIRSLIRQRGRIDAVSERQDTHLGQITLSAVFKRSPSGGYQPSILGTVPSTGTPIHVVTDEILDELLRPYQEEIVYLGRVYGSTPKLPLWFKHFSSGRGGAGEAYHIGIFGKTGSGKSVLAKMILVSYARHPNMAILVIDPQGEFAQDMQPGSFSGDFALPLGDVVRSLGREVAAINVHQLVLDRWDLFEEILYESSFFERLTISSENRRIACDVVVERLRRAKITLGQLHKRETFDMVWNLLGDSNVQMQIYRTQGPRDRFQTALSAANQDEFFDEYWAPICELFRRDRRGARTVDDALTWLLKAHDSKRPVLVLNLKKEDRLNILWNDKIQSLIIKRVLDGLTRMAEHFYTERTSLNTLVIIDEAHRLAPREAPDDEVARQVRAALVDAARTTRKYGLGWMFVSQTLHSLHQEILQQLRIFFFGFGLALGQEFQSLRQLVGSSDTALNLYQLFRDPHSTFDSSNRQYSFMTIGPVSPLSFSGAPLFLNVFTNKNEFLHVNNIPLDRS